MASEVPAVHETLCQFEVTLRSPVVARGPSLSAAWRRAFASIRGVTPRMLMTTPLTPLW